MHNLEFYDLGLINYGEALKSQEEALKAVQEGGSSRVLFCSHPPVVTLGRGFKNKTQELGQWQGDVVETQRGGKATYHGPNQLVIYPIVDLSQSGQRYNSKDIHAYLRDLEDCLIKTLSSFGITAERKETPKGSEKQFTGVWVGDKKIASIGIAVKKWVTYHGAAINLFKDANAFDGINPCGFTKDTMTSVEEVLGKKITYDEFKNEFQKNY